MGSALAMGSVDTPVLCAVACVAAAAAFSAWWSSDPLVPRRPATIIVLVGAGLVLFTAAQCIPMPRSVVVALSPHAADVWGRSLRPLGEEGPSLITLSLDPTATRIEVIRGVIYWLTFLAALRIAWRREGAVALEWTLVATGALITLVAAIHYGLGLERVYGFYRPRTDVTRIAPLLNTNHLAAYANIALVLSFASLLSQTPLFPRPLLAAVVLLLGAAEFWYASRGGVGAMIVGVIVVVLLSARAKASKLVSFALPATLALAGVAMLVLAAAPNSLRLAGTDLSKLDTARQVLTRMAPAYPWFGSGRGTFEQTFPEFREGSGFLVWSHPENLLAQWVSEWGIAVAVLALAALAYALRPRVAISRSNPAIGPWAAVVVVVLHNLVDFSMEIPAISLALAVCAALVVAGTGDPSRRAAALELWASRPRVLALSTLVALPLAAGLTFGRRAELLDDRIAIHDLLVANTLDDVFRPRLRRAMLDHPAEPYFPYVGAARALTDQKGNVIPWIDRTLDRSPIYPPAHLVLARWLRRRSPAQARLEYRLYAEQTGGQPLDVREVGPLVGSFEDALELTPGGSDGVPFLEALSIAIAERLPATQARIDAEILLRDPGATAPVLRMTHRAVADVADAPWCEAEPRPCVDDALVLAQRAENVAPTRCAGFAAHARLLYARGNAQAALDVLRSASDSVVDRAECERALAELAIEAGRYDEATAAIDALGRTPCGTDVACIDNLLLAAQLEDARGSSNRALVFLRLAAKAAPDDEEVVSRLAARASLAGLHSEAASAYMDLAAKHSGNVRYRTLADEERTLAAAAGSP